MNELHELGKAARQAEHGDPARVRTGRASHTLRRLLLEPLRLFRRHRCRLRFHDYEMAAGNVYRRCRLCGLVEGYDGDGGGFAGGDWVRLPAGEARRVERRHFPPPPTGGTP